MGLLLAALFAALTSSDAVAVLLNSASSCSVTRYAAAKALVEKEAKEGKPLQQFVIGVMSPGTDKGKRYLDEARPKIKMLAETKNNSLAWYLLSMETNDFKALQKAAKGGNVQALNALGTIATQEALNQKGVSTNLVEGVLKKSFGYFRQAALQKDPNGLINLGTCYLRGFGCDIDWEIAFQCFSAAARLGHPEGMDYVSACYEHGHGVKPDAGASLFWRMKARSLRGDKAAIEWLRNRK